MKKGKKIILTLAICGTLASTAYFGGALYKNSTPHCSTCMTDATTSNSSNYLSSNQVNKYTNINKLFEDDKSAEIVLENKALESALKRLLGVEKLHKNSITTHVDYGENETEPGSGVFVANKCSLDFSNTGITDITELCLFDFPSTLKAINLAGNHITNDDFAKLVEFTKIKAADNIDYNGKTITSVTNIDLILKKINLCFNDIDLNELQSADLTNNSFIFGVQRLYNIHSSRLVQTKELSQCYYYFKNDDFNYISPVFKRNNISVGFNENAITWICDSGNYGKYSISATGVGNSSSSYFGNWLDGEDFTVFTAKIADDYFLERTKPFTLPNDKLLFDGILPEWRIEGSPGTSKSGTFKLNITITYEGATRLIYIDYIVKDTIKPVITLIGESFMISGLNKAFNDPGCIGTDSDGVETISEDVESNANTVINIAQEGIYIITYTLKDKAGNEADPVTRTIKVKAGILDTIVVKKISKDKTLRTGDAIDLEVAPDYAKPTEYKNYKYYWYINGIRQDNYTLGNESTGKSIHSFTFDNPGKYLIKVVLKAQDTSGNGIEIHSDVMTLEVKNSLQDNDTIILATAITIGLILVVIVVITTVKVNKSNAKSHKKTTAYHKKNKPSNNGGGNIQVIKDYRPNGSGGNSNFKPHETSNNNQNSTPNNDKTK